MLPHSFYQQPTLAVAQQLLGKTLVRKTGKGILRAKIVETEAYMGDCDRACHAYPMKRTPRTDVMFAEGGVAYVYFIYGMHYCFNIVTEREGMPHAVLVRAVEPLDGWDVIAQHRFQKNYNELSTYQRKNSTNGPAKLCQAYEINKSLNGHSLLSNELYIEEGEEIKEEDIVSSKRINIDYAAEARDFLWRFSVRNNSYVSK